VPGRKTDVSDAAWLAEGVFFALSAKLRKSGSSLKEIVLGFVQVHHRLHYRMMRHAPQKLERRRFLDLVEGRQHARIAALPLPPASSDQGKDCRRGDSSRSSAEKGVPTRRSDRRG
jgi:hypothetical protein